MKLSIWLLLSISAFLSSPTCGLAQFDIYLSDYVTVERYTVLNATSMKSEQGRLSRNGQWEFVVTTTDTYSPTLIADFLPVSGYFISNLIEYDAYSSIQNVISNMVRSDRVYHIGIFDSVIVCIKGVCDPNPPYITSASTLPAANLNQSYSSTLNVTSGSAPFAWSLALGSLPQNLVLNPSTGVIGGTPTQTGTFTVWVRVTDSQQRASLKAFTLNVTGLPNLTPFQPAGWSDKIVVSRTTGTTTDSASLTTADALYLDWAVLNDGAAATAGPYFTALYVDGAPKNSWYRTSPLNANFYASINDYSIGSLSAGTHTIRIVADSTGTMTESNESDNEYTKTINVGVPAQPDFAVSGITLNPASPLPGQSFTAYVTVTNQGNSSGSGGWLDVWKNQPTSQACGAVGDSYFNVGTLAASASLMFTFNGLVAPASSAPWTFRAFVDSGCSTTESTEGNNQVTVSYGINSPSQSFTWPVDTHPIGQSYAAYNVGAPNKYHTGIDIGDGNYLYTTDARAVRPGTVHKIFGINGLPSSNNLRRWNALNGTYSWDAQPTTDADGQSYGTDNHGLGICVILYHSELHIYTLYGHLDAVAAGLSPGQSVSAGSVIGRMGNSYKQYLRRSPAVDGTPPTPQGGPPPGYSWSNLITADASGFRPHVHLEARMWGELGSLDDDAGPEWGYTTNFPNLCGYLNPYPYLEFNIASITQVAVSSPSTQTVRTGPDVSYTAPVASISTEQEFIAFSSYGGWHQVYLASTNGPASGWIQATPDPSAVLLEISDPARGLTGVGVRDTPSAAGYRYGFIWDKQWLVQASSTASGNGCSSQWHQTHLASNMGAGLGWFCGDYAIVHSALLVPYTYTTNTGAITITGYMGPGGVVIIPGAINGLPVTRIGDYAFNSRTNVSSVTIPNGVTSIGAWAFAYCTGLTNVTIHNSVTSIDGLAFVRCTGLASITIPASVTTIGGQAFESCTSLTAVMIPANVTNIGVLAFGECTNLSGIAVDANNLYYSSMVGVLFNKSQTTLIQYPGGIAGSYAIPGSVTHISDYAFYFCINLTSVTIPNSVTRIGSYAFADCGVLTSVAIPNSVTSIGEGPFAGCTSLSAITVDATNSFYSSPNGVLFNKSQTTLIQYPAAKVESSYTIPKSVTSVGNYAFHYCSKLTSVTIPNSVNYLGRDSFSACASLTGIYFLGNAPNIGSFVFAGDNNTTVYYLPGTTGWEPTFEGRPTALWLLPGPLILNNGPSVGVQTNGFGFVISWATNIPVVVEASTSLANPTWLPVATNALIAGVSYFSDRGWTNHSERFYRVRSP